MNLKFGDFCYNLAQKKIKMVDIFHSYWSYVETTLKEFFLYK